MSLVNEHGADVLRLWVASQDYQNDIPFSHDILARVADTYRSIRNTIRILLGNIADFNPAKNLVPDHDWPLVDRYIYARYQEMLLKVEDHYAAYEFSQVYHVVNRFCAVELSSLYVDVLKDRLYCNAANDPARRASQNVMYCVLRGLLMSLAPLIPFTTDEAWAQLKEQASIHVEKMPVSHFCPDGKESENNVLKQVTPLLDLRSRVNEKLEEARREKKIGKALEARVVITGRPPLGTAAATTEGNADLEELFIVSKVVVKPTEGEETITVTRAEDHGMKKCVRCWKYWDHVGKIDKDNHPDLCDRCTKVVLDWKQ